MASRGIGASVQLPLASYPREALVLTLIVLSGLATVNNPSGQVVPRVGLAQSLLEGRLDIDEYAARTIDRAYRGGHFYSDKAPGISIVAALPLGLLRAVEPSFADTRTKRLWWSEGSLWLWLVSLVTVGPFFVLATFLVGRVAEGVAVGTGALSAVAFGLGTLFNPLASSFFGHVPAGALALLGFLLATRSGPGALLCAGLAAGAAVLFEYQAALLLVLVVAYALSRGAWAAALVALGALPGLAVLALYNTLAFGSPLRLSYEYVDNFYAEQQRGGFFGIGVPRPDALVTVLVGERGLILLSPIVVVGAVGLVLLARLGWLRETLVCAAATFLFLLVNSGYFLPYGGVSPGPRFFAPALPFLALGLGPAFGRWRTPAVIATAISVAGMAIADLTWSSSSSDGGLVPSQENLARTVWMEIAGDRIQSAAATTGLAVAAVALALRAGRRLDAQQAPCTVRRNS